MTAEDLELYKLLGFSEVIFLCFCSGVNKKNNV